jgi:hypothetical protein
MWNPHSLSILRDWILGLGSVRDLTEETVVHGVVVVLTVMAGLRFIVKEGCDIYDEIHKKMKRRRRRAP